MTYSFHKDESKSSPAEDQLKDSVETTESSPQGCRDFSHDHIIDAFIFFGHDREEAEQWIRTSLRTTRLFLEQSLRIEPKHWSDKYPTTPRNDIQDALKSDICAALWYLTGGVEEKYKRPSWRPIPGIEFCIHTKDLFETLAANPENPEDIGAEKQIERLKKELEHISERVRKEKATLPYRLRNAPSWKLIALGRKGRGKGKGHKFLPIFYIRTKDLFERIAANPEDPEDIRAEKQIERLKKELEDIFEKIRKGKTALPYNLKNAPDWTLIALGSKGKAKDHEFTWASVTSHETQEEIEASIKKETEAGNVVIENHGE